MPQHAIIGIYGANGHTARLIAREFHRRTLAVKLAARSPGAAEFAEEIGSELLQFDLADQDTLERFVDGLAVLINCAGPFSPTAQPLAQAAVRAGAHYIDISGEPPVVAQLCDALHEVALARQRYVLPAAGFFGALGDLLAAAASEQASRVDAVNIAYFLSSWTMTPGSALAAQGLRGRQFRSEHGRLVQTQGGPRLSRHLFPDPVGDIAVIDDYPSPEVVLLPRRVDVSRMSAMMSASTFANAATSSKEPAAPAEMVFLVEASVTVAGKTVRAAASGHDIYAITAPIVAEIASRLPSTRPSGGGVVTPAQIFPPSEFLHTIADRFTTLELGA